MPTSRSWDRKPRAFSRETGAGVAQRSIEILIGRLITDEAFRDAFFIDQRQALGRFHESGYELTPIEVWRRAAEHIDPRLQKVDLSRSL